MGFYYMDVWMIGVWLINLILAYLVYKDAGKRGMNGVLWGILVALPWIGIVFLFVYLITREEKYLSSEGSHIKTLEERYARGEITREDYLRMKEDMKK